MKKLIFTLIAVAFLYSQGMTQISLNQWDIAQPLTKYVQYNDTLPPATIKPGAPGVNLVWNFSALQKLTTDTIFFTNSHWTSYGLAFPNSNLSFYLNNVSSGFTFLENTAGSLSIVGQAMVIPQLGTPIVVALNPAEKQMNFPSTYQSSFSDTSRFKVVVYYGQSGVDSIRVKNTTTTQSIFDAWGSLTTVLGTFNCIRQNVTRISQDSVWVRLLGNWMDVTSAYGQKDTVKTYSWWTNNVGYSLLDMTVKPTTDSVLSVSYLASLPQPGGIKEIASNSFFSVYPNPASGVINLQSSQLIEKAEIYNTLGELVRSASLNKLTGTVDISALPKGVYTLKLYNEKGVGVRKFVKE